MNHSAHREIIISRCEQTGNEMKMDMCYHLTWYGDLSKFSKRENSTSSESMESPKSPNNTDSLDSQH